MMPEVRWAKRNHAQQHADTEDEIFDCMAVGKGQSAEN
jgi:hypothetical protein